MQTNTHISLDALAALAEGHLDGEEGAAAREHMTRCRSCHAAYADTVRYRAVELDDPDTFAPTEDMIRIGNAVIGDDRPAPSRAIRRAPLLLRPAALAAPALALILVGLFLWPGLGLLQNEPALNSQTVSCVREAIAGASVRGMVLPGAGTGTGADAPIYRSGGPTAGEDLTAAIDALAQSYEADHASRAAAFWLIAGQTAAGQLTNANVYVKEARERFAHDDRFAVLEAIIAYRESDLTRAERILRAVVDRDPDNLTARFNLGFLLGEKGQLAETAELLRPVIGGPNRFLGERAAAFMEARYID